MLYSKDQLANYMVQGHVHLSKKDYGFFHNLLNIIRDKRPITSNQTKLFDKLITKYQKQLKKNNYDTSQLLDLPWNAQVVESMAEFLEPKIFLENGKLCIKSPFNSKFITSLRQQKLNTFIWNKKEKIYESCLSTYALKKAVELVTKIYGKVTYCQKIQTLIDETKIFDSKYWSPTLVKRHNNFYILATNTSLDNVLGNLQLNDDPKTLFTLSSYGVKTDLEITKDKDFLEFASSYRTVVNIDNLSLMVDWLVYLDVDYVCLSKDLAYNKSISTELINLLKNKILYGTSYSNQSKNMVRLSLHSKQFYNPSDTPFSKQIFISNTRPVIVK